MTATKERVCKKVKYRSKSVALTARDRRMASLRKSKAASLDVYECPKCDGWHLTSQVGLTPRAPHRVCRDMGVLDARLCFIGTCTCGHTAPAKTVATAAFLSWAHRAGAA